MLDNSVTQYLIWSLSASDRYLSSVSSCWTDWASDLRCNIRLDSVLVWIRMSRFYYIIISPDSLIFRPFAQGKAANGVCFGCVRVCLFFSSFCTVSCTFMNSANPIIISWSLRNQLIFFFFHFILIYFRYWNKLLKSYINMDQIQNNDCGLVSESGIWSMLFIRYSQ